MNRIPKQEGQRSRERWSTDPVPKASPATPAVTFAAAHGNAALSRSMATADKFKPALAAMARQVAAPAIDPAVAKGVKDAEAFVKGGAKEKKGFTPASGGGFDAKYDPRGGKLGITVKAGIQYTDGLDKSGTPAPDTNLNQSVAKFNSLKNAARKEAFLRKFRWTAAEKLPWRQQLETVVEKMWSAKHEFHVFKPGWTWVGAKPVVDIKVSEVKAGAARPADMHLLVTAIKVPTDLDPADSVNSAVNDPDFGKPAGAKQSAFDQTATLGSLDVKPRRDNLLAMSVGFAKEGQTDIDAADKPRIRNFAKRLNGFVDDAGKAKSPAATPVDLTVTGHATSTGSRAKNKDIVEKRVANVVKELETGGFKGVKSRVHEVDKGSATNARRVDIKAGDGAAQVVAAHEFGHAFGLDDEYHNAGNLGKPTEHDAAAKKIIGADGKPLPGSVHSRDDGLMSSGNKVRERHYATFIEALESVSGQGPWQVGPKEPKPKLPEPKKP